MKKLFLQTKFTCKFENVVVLTKKYNGISAAFVGYFESRIGDILFASPIAIVSLEIEK